MLKRRYLIAASFALAATGTQSLIPSPTLASAPSSEATQTALLTPINGPIRAEELVSSRAGQSRSPISKNQSTSNVGAIFEGEAGLMTGTAGVEDTTAAGPSTATQVTVKTTGDETGEARAQTNPTTAAVMPPSADANSASADVTSTSIEVRSTSTKFTTAAAQAHIPTARIDAPIVDALIVIDNDDAKVEEVTEYQWKEIVDEEGRTHIDSGARFPVCVVTAHSSKTAKVGDPVEALLKVDLKIGGKLVATKGSRVIGHVSVCRPARKILHAELSRKRWMRPSGAMAIQFDEIITVDGQHLPLVAVPARQPRIVNNAAEGRVLGVNMNGEISAPLSGQLKAQGIHLAIRAGASAGGVFSFGAVPVAYGLLGAVNPSFAFMHPVGHNVRHRRIKGFAMGAVSGLPGGFLISDSLISGPEAIIKPGDEFLAEFKQSFTGEPVSEVVLMPSVKTKVHGEILPDSDGKPDTDKL